MHVDDLKIVVSCPIKNDNEYLIEFVEHYLNLGFNAIYLYDNNDDDSIIPSEILASISIKIKSKLLIIESKSLMMFGTERISFLLMTLIGSFLSMMTNFWN